MPPKYPWYLSVLFLASALLLSACTPFMADSNDSKSSALTWGTFGSYAAHKAFIELLQETYPEIELEFISYSGRNRTAYSWAQMRADDIPDIFITTQILDEELEVERLADLSEYPFINNFSSVILEQVETGGRLYLLPASNTMYGIAYNKTLMEEHGWEVPADFAQLEALCEEIKEAGLIPGILGTQLKGNSFSAVFNLAKTSWLATPEGSRWERDFLAGNATAKGMWEGTMDYVQRYIDIGMFTTDPEDRGNNVLIQDYLGGRKAVFFTAAHAVFSRFIAESTDELAMMPYISEDGSKNIYMYNPSWYFGLSKRLTEPGNEQKLEDAVKILSLLFSPEGQAAILSDSSVSTFSVLNSSQVSEDALVYDGLQALRDGRGFPMTYAHWEFVLADIGQAYKEWIRGENDMDGEKCIAMMDEYQRIYLDSKEQLYFCESTADFTLEETALLVGKALGSALGADAVMVSLSEFHDGLENSEGLSGKLYAGPISEEIGTSILPGTDGECALMTMTGAQAKKLAQEGFDRNQDNMPYPYILVTRGDIDLEDGQVYQIAFLMKGYTEEAARTYSAEVIQGSLQKILRDYLEDQGTVSPDGNPWE